MEIKDTNKVVHLLNSTSLKEQADDEGHYFYVSLSALKRAIKKEEPILIRCPACKRQQGDVYNPLEVDTIVTEKSISIGCKKFAGKNAEAIFAAIQ